MNLMSQLQVLHINAPKLATACGSLLNTLPRSRHAITEPFRRSQRALHQCCHAAAEQDGAAAGQGAADPSPPPPPPPPLPTAALGQVMAAQANFVRVKVERLDDDAGGSSGSGGALPPPPRTRLLCVVRGLLKKMKREVLVGDFVRVVGIDWTDGRGMVEEVLPRRSRLAEPAVANVTQVVLVFSLARPPFAPGPATRYLVGAEAAGLPVTLLLNKADLLGEEEVQAVVDEVAGWGYNAVPVSVASGRGMRELGTALAGKVSVLAGPSGAGKSSIINVLRRDAHAEAVADAEAAEAADAAAAAAELAGAEEACSGGESGSGSECEAEEEEADEEGQAAAADDADAYAEGGAEMQAVGEVSERIGRGKHTTRNVTLLEMGAGGGLLVDTPGFNQPDVSALPAAELAQYFPEIQAVLAEQRCVFADCQHLVEPGCAVIAAGLERYEMYADMHAELKTAAEAEISRMAGKRAREGTVRYKSRTGGKQGAEARLEPKTHRRVSRRSVNQWLSDVAKEAEEE